MKKKWETKKDESKEKMGKIKCGKSPVPGGKIHQKNGF